MIVKYRERQSLQSSINSKKNRFLVWLCLCRRHPSPIHSFCYIKYTQWHCGVCIAESWTSRYIGVVYVKPQTFKIVLRPENSEILSFIQLHLYERAKNVYIRLYIFVFFLQRGWD